MTSAGVPTNQYKCYACRGNFSVKVGTIFQDTKLPLRTWFAAIWTRVNATKPCFRRLKAPCRGRC